MSGLRMHMLSSGNTYLPMAFDIYSADTHRVVASGAGADRIARRGSTALRAEARHLQDRSRGRAVQRARRLRRSRPSSPIR